MRISQLRWLLRWPCTCKPSEYCISERRASSNRCLDTFLLKFGFWGFISKLRFLTYIASFYNCKVQATIRQIQINFTVLSFVWSWLISIWSISSASFWPNTLHRSRFSWREAFRVRAWNYNHGRKCCNKFALLALLRTRQTRIQRHMPNFASHPPYNVEN